MPRTFTHLLAQDRLRWGMNNSRTMGLNKAESVKMGSQSLWPFIWGNPAENQSYTQCVPHHWYLLSRWGEGSGTTGALGTSRGWALPLQASPVRQSLLFLLHSHCQQGCSPPSQELTWLWVHQWLKTIGENKKKSLLWLFSPPIKGSGKGAPSLMSYQVSAGPGWLHPGHNGKLKIRHISSSLSDGGLN